MPFISRNNIIELIRSARDIIPKILEWYHSNSLLVHPLKTQSIIFKTPRARLSEEELRIKQDFDVKIDMNNIGEDIEEKITKLKLIEDGGSIKHLGMRIDDTLSFKHHINNVYNRNSKIIYSMRQMRHLLDRKHLLLLYNSYIKSYIEYSSILLCGAPKSLLDPIIKQQKNAVRIIEGLKSRDHTAEYLKKKFILPFPLLIKFNCSIFMHRYKYQLQPEIFKDVWPQQLNQHNHFTRNRANFTYVAGISRNFILNSPLHRLPTIYNDLPNVMKEIDNQKEFKRKCFTYFLNQIDI